MKNPTRTHLTAPPKPKLRKNFFLNGKVSHQIHNGMHPSLTIENLTDSNYARKLGFPEPSRQFFHGDITTNATIRTNQK